MTFVGTTASDPHMRPCPSPTPTPAGPGRAPLSALRFGLLLAPMLAAGALGCDETIEIGNEPAVVTVVGPVRGEAPGFEPSSSPPSDGRVFVGYALRDTEFDDVDIVVTVCACAEQSGDEDECTREACGFAIQGQGGDGTSRLPTLPPWAELDHAQHTFVWNAAAGRVSEDGVLASTATTRYVVGIAVQGDADDPLFSTPFNLEALGVTLDDD